MSENSGFRGRTKVIVEKCLLCPPFHMTGSGMSDAGGGMPETYTNPPCNLTKDNAKLLAGYVGEISLSNHPTIRALKVLNLWQ